MKPDASAKQQSSHPQSPAPRAAATGSEGDSTFLVKGSPNPSTADLAEAILRAIQNAARARGASENRESTRYHHCVPLTLHIDDPRKPGTRVIRAASSNLSIGGFAFIFDAAISTGSTVRAQFDSLPGKPQIGGVVRSCVHICGTQHRVGVEYQ
ncbi:MAG TPA: PilZ domain-containing protein [Phycisphaerales bacterium]|nr:PilZ domain-containing protein [Phycisphaerales bacterium]